MNDYELTIDDLTLTKDSESCRLTAYPDPGTGGAPITIGWGHTGPEVHLGLVWTQEQADAQLVKDMQRAEANVRQYVTHPITKEQFIALCDLAFNIGNTAFDTSTLLRKLNAFDVDGAIAEFARWNRGGGRVLQGLVKRRDGEKALFLLGTSYG
jgi:lysozyme